MDDLYTAAGMQGLLNIIITLVCILVSWWALKVVRMDVFIKDIRSPQSKLLQLILAVVLGHSLGRFFIDYSNWSSYIKGLF